MLQCPFPEINHEMLQIISDISDEGFLQGQCEETLDAMHTHEKGCLAQRNALAVIQEPHKHVFKPR